MDRLRLLKISLASAVMFGLMAGASAYAADTVGLITKTETNPFFVKMREGAEAKAKELGVQLIACAGKFDGDNDGQVACDRKPDLGRRPRASQSCRAIPRPSCRPSRRRATPA